MIKQNALTHNRHKPSLFIILLTNIIITNQPQHSTIHFTNPNILPNRHNNPLPNIHGMEHYQIHITIN